MTKNILNAIALMNPEQEAILSTTSPERLQKLALSECDAIKKAVVANPNTPIDILWKLGQEFPEQLLQNPVFNLLFLDNPKLPTQIPFETLQSLLELEQIPNYFVELVINNPDKRFRGRVAEYIKAPLKILEILAEDNEKYVRLSVACNSSAPINILEKLSDDEDFDVRIAVANNLNTPERLLKKLADEGYFDIRHSVTTNPNASEEFLEYLASLNDYYIYHALVQNPKTPAHLLASIANTWISDRNPNPSNRSYFLRAIAAHQNTPIKLLEILASDRENSIRYTVAANLKTPTNILEILAKDNDFYVRRKIAENPNTPVKILKILAQDENIYVRQAATNRNLKEE